MKGGTTHIDRTHLKVRQQLVRAHTGFRNQLRGLLKLFGLRLGSATTPARRAERLRALLAQKPELEVPLTPLVAALAALEEQIVAATRELKRRAAADPVCARFMSVPGVGPVAALTYLTSIEDPSRFARGADVGAFAGLVPRRHQSGERDTMGHISRAGDPMLRHSLYEAANSLLGRVKRDCALRRWGLDLAATKGAKRARVAVARKLAILLHTLWRTEANFRWA
jgi:transposase